jgi:hypothetical protein
MFPLPRSVTYLAEVVRHGGLRYALQLPEPLPAPPAGGDRPVVADGGRRMARWWEAVAEILAMRRATGKVSEHHHHDSELPGQRVVVSRTWLARAPLLKAVEQDDGGFAAFAGGEDEVAVWRRSRPRPQGRR